MSSAILAEDKLILHILHNLIDVNVWEDIAVTVQPSCHLTRLASEELRTIFCRQFSVWLWEPYPHIYFCIIDKMSRSCYFIIMFAYRRMFQWMHQDDLKRNCFSVTVPLSPFCHLLTDAHFTTCAWWMRSLNYCRALQWNKRPESNYFLKTWRNLRPSSFFVGTAHVHRLSSANSVSGLILIIERMNRLFSLLNLKV